VSEQASLEGRYRARLLAIQGKVWRPRTERHGHFHYRGAALENTVRVRGLWWIQTWLHRSNRVMEGLEPNPMLMHAANEAVGDERG
jgi:hypothetical protein